MDATLSELKCKYRNAVFTAHRLLSMAEESRIGGLPQVHDHLVAAANEYKKHFIAIREQAYKAFPDMAAKELAFEIETLDLALEEEPNA